MRKVASPRWIKMLQQGRLSPGSVEQIARTMPEGSARQVRYLGAGENQMADLMAGNVGGHQGLLVRKLPLRRLPNMADASRQQMAGWEELSARLTPEQRSMFAPILAGNERGVFQAFGNRQVLPGWKPEYGQHADWNRLPPEVRRPFMNQLRPLEQQGVGDLHPRNLGSGGQVIDWEYGPSMLTQRVKKYVVPATGKSLDTRPHLQNQVRRHWLGPQPEAPSRAWGGYLRQLYNRFLGGGA